MRTLATSRCRAFSLIEASVVVVMLGILAAGAVPAFRSMAATHEAGAVAEVERALVLARASAMATGVATGVAFAPDKGQILLVRVAGDGRGTEPLPDALGNERAPLPVGKMYGGVAVGAPRAEGRRDTLDTIWFGHRGAPEDRGRDAALIDDFEQDIVIRIGAEGVLRVRARSGLMERGA